jgi:hypothetical protein
VSSNAFQFTVEGGGRGGGGGGGLSSLPSKNIFKEKRSVNNSRTPEGEEINPADEARPLCFCFGTKSSGLS